MFKLIFKLLMFLPILLGMMYVSYTVDPSGMFWGAGFEREAAEYMLEGAHIDGYERLDGRKLNEVYAKNVKYTPEVLMNGSSRSMMVTQKFANGKTFYNCANVGADIYDFFTSYYIFAKEGKEPQTMVLSVDPWIFNRHPDAIDYRSNKELYYEFIGEELGYKNDEYKPVNPYQKYLALLDPSYFQGSVKYAKKDKSTEQKPHAIYEDLYNQQLVIKSPDGSIIYDIDFRTRSQEKADSEAYYITRPNVILMRMDGFTTLDKTYTEQFTKFIEYLQKKNINVVLFLPPYHPYFYQSALEQRSKYEGFFLAEDFCNQIAEKYGLKIYGSYNAGKLGLKNTDFYDGLHVRAESVEKFFPGV